MKRVNNNRRFPGETNRNRPDKAATRREEAIARQDITDALSPQQRVERLDMKFGDGKGAKKERARLLVLFVKGKDVIKAPPSDIQLEKQQLPDDIMQEIASLNEEMGSKKRLKAKDRRAKAKKE